MACCEFVARGISPARAGQAGDLPARFGSAPCVSRRAPV